MSAGRIFLAGFLLNETRLATSNFRLTDLGFFGGGDGKPQGNFFIINGTASPSVPTIFRC